MIVIDTHGWSSKTSQSQGTSSADQYTTDNIRTTSWAGGGPEGRRVSGGLGQRVIGRMRRDRADGELWQAGGVAAHRVLDDTMRFLDIDYWVPVRSDLRTR
jgi:hypothetical protein